MIKLNKKDERAKEIDKAIRLALGSLESHLPYTHGGKMVRFETHRFHQKCIAEYAEIISILSKLY